MTTTKFLASSVMALAALAAGNAFADSSNYPSAMVATSQNTVTRAEVHADLTQAQKSSNWLAMNDHKNYPMTMNAGSSVSRADVKAALNEARQDGTLADYHS